MAHCIALFYAILCTFLVRLLLPPLGRHRTVRRPLGARTRSLTTATGSGTHTPRQHRHQHRLRGEDSPLVRPYALTPAERQQRQRHYRALRLAEQGIDADPRRFQGVEVAAR